MYLVDLSLIMFFGDNFVKVGWLIVFDLLRMSVIGFVWVEFLVIIILLMIVVMWNNFDIIGLNLENMVIFLVF